MGRKKANDHVRLNIFVTKQHLDYLDEVVLRDDYVSRVELLRKIIKDFIVKDMEQHGEA